MKKEILVFEKNEESLNFLKRFFKEHPNYSVFYAEEQTFFQRVTSKKPAAVIIGASAKLINSMSKITCPVIAMVAGDINRGMKLVMKSNIEFYLISPFYDEDFEHKLNLAIKNHVWINNISKEKRDLETIVELTHLISSTLDPKEVLYFIVKKIAEAIDVSRCSIISIPMKEKKHAYVISTFEDIGKSTIKLELKKYPEIKKALATKNIIFIKDALHDPLMKDVRRFIEPLGICSIVVIPIIFRHEVIGTLFLRTSRAKHNFTDKELRLCNSIAAASTNAVYNSFLYERLESDKVKLEKYATRDFLTGIYNIRYFYERLEEEFNRAKRYKFPLSCLMFDIDHFKKVNDTYGHRVGDMVLKEMTGCIKKHTRKIDVFARYGGEEFVMLLPQTSLEGAVNEAERLRKTIKALKFKSLGNKRGVTVSVGVASYPHKKIDVYDDIVGFADNALLAAKRGGRDQVKIFN